MGTDSTSMNNEHYNYGRDDLSMDPTEFDMDGLMGDYLSEFAMSPTHAGQEKPSTEVEAKTTGEVDSVDKNSYKETSRKTAEFSYSTHCDNDGFLSPSNSSNHQSVETNSPGGSSHLNGGDENGNFSSFDSPNMWRLTNAVHMEVQENAKISTINWNIDRSNSVNISNTSHSAPASTSLINNNSCSTNTLSNIESTHSVSVATLHPPQLPSIGKSTTTDSPPSLGFFLNREARKGRSSSNASYAGTGRTQFDLTNTSSKARLDSINLPLLPPPLHASKQETSTRNSIQSISPKDSMSKPPLHEVTVATTGTLTNHPYEEDDSKIMELTAGVNPTPLSEIKRKHSSQAILDPLPSSQFNVYYSYNNKPTSSSTETGLPLSNNNSGFLFYVPRRTQAIVAGATSNSNFFDSPASPSSKNALGADVAAPQDTSTPAAMSSGASVPIVRIKDGEAMMLPLGRSFEPGSFPSNVSTNSTNTGQQQLNSTLAATNCSITTSAPLDKDHSFFQHMHHQQQQRSFPHHHHDHLRSVAAPVHAEARSISTGALLRASKQKSQYGFGSKHVVPSIPTTLAKSRQNKCISSNSAAATVAKNKRTTSKQAPMSKVVGVKGRSAERSKKESKTSSSELQGLQVDRPSSETNNNSPTSNANTNSICALHGTDAYERKKARAKTARVLLNESIDRLSVAINLAGTQSEQRRNQIDLMRREMISIQCPSATTSSSSLLVSAPIAFIASKVMNNGCKNTLTGESDLSSTYSFNATDTNIMSAVQECSQIAETAKKFDRPSFIGSSATMIQALNAQCESLMRELVAYHVQNMSLVRQQQQYVQQRPLDLPAPVSQINNESIVEKEKDTESNENETSVARNMDSRKHSHQSDETTSNTDMYESPEKRRRVEESASSAARMKFTSKSVAPSRVSPTSTANKLLQHCRVMDRIVSFLDVPTKALCVLKVSNRWNRGQHFAIEPIWCNLTLTRFGCTNVRQWRTKMEDIPEVIAVDCSTNNDNIAIDNLSVVIVGDHDHDRGNREDRMGIERYCDAYDSCASSTLPTCNSPALSSLSLYRVMDKNNVMPTFRRLSNMVYLGETRLPGKISAWTFLIDRSNGETMRSVRRQPPSTLSPKEFNSPLSLSNNKSTPVPTVATFTSMAVVQLWTIIQNTAIGYCEPIVLREQKLSVDSSTRRRKDEMIEIDWDERLQKRILHLDGSPYCKKNDSMSSLATATSSSLGQKELCHIQLFDSVIVESYIHAKGCSTTSKFIQRSNYTKILVQVPFMTTVPVVIPFPQDSSHLTTT